ncbi:MAG TPA: hypothetical protein VJ385_21380 [Fibrobacteria bacterium]|nr:hypothetical protein [Fibrobacteria bacterium]
MNSIIPNRLSCRSGLFPGIACLALILGACLRDGGIVDPSDVGGVQSLGRFQGRAFNEGDTNFTVKRYQALTHPKIALIWQFIGPKEFTYSSTEGLIKNANPPYDFEVDVRTPPAEEILGSPDLAVGTFWLYEDANGNGVFDRLIHPSLLSLNRIVDEMYAGYNAAMDSLLQVSEVKPIRVGVVETYYVGLYGTTVRVVDGKPDTIWTGTSAQAAAQAPWVDILNNRFRVLNCPNRWERFFALRGRSNDYYRVSKPAAGFAFGFDFPYDRKLFPLPGKEKEFEALVREATSRLIDINARYESLRSDAITKGFIDYPYAGVEEAGQDWAAGRTRKYFLLYLRNAEALDELVESERISSFNVAGKEKLHLGYNLVWCGEKYVCKVLDPSDSIHIDLGMSEAYFNPPSAPLANPVVAPEEIAYGTDRLARLQGAYRFQPLRPFSLMAVRGALWASIPNVGTYRFLPADSLVFFAPAADMQIQIVKQQGKVEKLLLYRSGSRLVATRDSAAGIPAEAESRILAASGRIGIRIDAGKTAGFGGKYEYAGDTLAIEPAPGGDSLRVRVPGMKPLYYLAESESVFFSPDCDCRLALRQDGSGKTAAAVLELEGSAIFAPALSRVPRSPAELFPGTPSDPDSVVSFSEGSARDTYAWLDGKGRYQGSEDGRYLIAGDGWVTALDHTLPGETATLSRGGEGIVFRAEGLQGRNAGLELRLRKDRTTGKGRVLFRLRGGGDAANLNQILSDDFWVDFAGDSAVATLKAWPVHSDPYYVRLERVTTAYSDFPLAFDSYRWLTSRDSLAHP